MQKAVKAAATAARIHKPVSVHTLHPSFATHLLLAGVALNAITHSGTAASNLPHGQRRGIAAGEPVGS